MVRLSIGSVWRMTADIVRRHFSTFTTLAAAFVFLPAVLGSAIFPHLGTLPMPLPGQPAPPFPGGLFLLLIGTTLIGLIGHFSIGAIAVDPAEGGGRSIGEIITVVLPKIGKGLLAGLYLVVAYVTIAFLLVILISILAGMFGAVSGSARMSVASARVAPPAELVALVGWLIAAIGLPLMIWMSARLLPLLGVLLREPLSAIDSIKRAWGLSRGSVMPIVGLLLIVGIASILPSVILERLRQGFGIDRGVELLLFTVGRCALSALIAVYYYTAAAVTYRQLAEGS